MNKYKNRQEAGRILAGELRTYMDKEDVLILALPRGGVPVAFGIAKALHLPLDIFVVRKLGVPGHTELAMGAIAASGAKVFNDEIVRHLKISEAEIANVIEQEMKELKRRELAYRGDRPFPVVKNKTIILVDDGIATGATMRAAIKALQQLQPNEIIVAVPVAEKFLCQTLTQMVDQLVCPMQPLDFQAVGLWYDYFDQTTDEEVRTLLDQAKKFVVQ